MIAVYSRVSSDSQTTASQDTELDRWLEREAVPPSDVKLYSDTYTGTKMNRPGFNAMMADVDAGKIDKILIWRLDRLGRTAAGVISLFDHLNELGVSLISIKDGFDLSTVTGRLLANMLASFAQFETEVRRERQAAGIAIAKQRGVYKGRKKGTPRMNPIKAWRLRQKGITYSDIGRLLKIAPSTAIEYVKLHDQKIADDIAKKTKASDRGEGREVQQEQSVTAPLQIDDLDLDLNLNLELEVADIMGEMYYWSEPNDPDNFDVDDSDISKYGIAITASMRSLTIACILQSEFRKSSAPMHWRELLPCPTNRIVRNDVQQENGTGDERCLN